jgi:hypothetical protein
MLKRTVKKRTTIWIPTWSPTVLTGPTMLNFAEQTKEKVSGMVVPTFQFCHPSKLTPKDQNTVQVLRHIARFYVHMDTKQQCTYGTSCVDFVTVVLLVYCFQALKAILSLRVSQSPRTPATGIQVSVPIPKRLILTFLKNTGTCQYCTVFTLQENLLIEIEFKRTLIYLPKATSLF